MNNRIAVVGTFDGVHLGHRYLLESLKREAGARGLIPEVVTFSRHPLAVVRPDAAPLALTTLDERVSLIENAGIEDVVVLEFDDSMRMWSARRFMEMLRDRHGVAAMLVGYNHRFGHDKGLVFDDYRCIGEEIGVTVIQADEYCPDGVGKVSSSVIRGLLADGDVAAAAKALGYPYSIRGVVGHGKKIGRELGFPTANVQDVDSLKIIPLSGVYEALVTLDDGSRWRSVVNIGRRPTVDCSANPRVTIEAHLVGYEGDLYGRSLELSFVKRIREERHFSSLCELRSQIAADLDSIVQS